MVHWYNAYYMRQVYEEEKQKKYLQELRDLESRRHTDNFTPSQKSPVSLTRYDKVFDDMPLSRYIGFDMPRTPARVLFDFRPATSKELSLRKGEIVYITRRIDKNWYEGERHGVSGWFPVNYVDLLPWSSYYSRDYLARKPFEGYARAKYNFNAVVPLEMSLRKGEYVVLTKRVDNNWYEGRIGSYKGIFPCSYVEVFLEPSEGYRASSLSPSLKSVSNSMSSLSLKSYWAESAVIV